MGGYKIQSDSKIPGVKKYTSRIGTLITLFNLLDHDIQSFIEAILDLENNKKTTLTIFFLIRNLSFSKRLEFLDVLLKDKHDRKIDSYINLRSEIVKCSKIRNSFAHSQTYFTQDDNGTHMLISSFQKTKDSQKEKPFDEITPKDLNAHIKRFRKLIDNFNYFTWELGYFQG
jgi:hypothetical protein